MEQECYKRKEKCMHNTIIKGFTTYGCEVCQIKKKFKNYSLWKWTSGADQQEHREEKRLEMK
jgi:hypothetical protein